MTECFFEEVTTENIRRLNHFLKQQGEPSANRGDWNYWLKMHGKIIAVGRLILIDNHTQKEAWLRGVFVVEAYRKRGFGHFLMQNIHQSVRQKQKGLTCNNQACSFSIYAFPHMHLEAFYGTIGYQHCPPNDLPSALHAKYLQAQKNTKNWLCMQLKFS